MNKRRPLVVCAAFTAIIVCGFLFWSRETGDIGRTVSLPDGSTMTLVSVSYGTNHMSGGKMEGQLARFLPAKLANLLGISAPQAMQSGTPSLGIWLRVRGRLSKATSLAASLADESGCEYPVEETEATCWLPSGEKLVGFALATFPRRGNTILLRVGEPDGAGKYLRTNFAEFRLLNPARGIYAAWKADPLPISRSAGDLEVTVTELGIDTDKSEEWGPNSGALSKLCCIVRQNGQPTTDWRIESVEIADATGNHRCEDWWKFSSDADLLQTYYLRGLWANEPAWRLRLRLTRELEAHFEAEELWTFRGVAVPATNSVTQVEATKQFPGGTVRLVGLKGRYGKFTNYNGTLGEGARCLIFDTSGMFKDAQIFVVRANDNEGKDVPWNGTFIDTGQSGLALDYSTRAQTVDVTVAVHKSRFVEFLVKPELLKSGRTDHKRVTNQEQ